MKKALTILMALMVLCFTQCKKPIDELTGRKVKVSCTIPINKGGRSDLTSLMEDGSIKWSTGTERIYLALPNETNPQIIELTAFSTLQSSELAFEGEVDENLLEEGEEYEVWYLGNSKNLDDPYITENKVGEDEIITSVSGSIAEQSGSIGDLGYCHIAKVSVTAVEEDGEIILPLRGVLKNQIAIAYLDLEGVEELSGAAIKGTEYSLQYNESANKYDFVVTENASAAINVTAGTSKSFIVLLPNDNNNVILKCSKGGYEFKKGVESNKFYYRYISNVEKGTLRWAEIEEDDEPDTPDSTAPKNLVATATGQTTISLTWNAVQNATSYNVYSNGNLVVSDLTATTYTVEGLTAGTEYCYNVTAVNEIGESEHSTEACATTEEAPIVIETITVNGVSFNMIQVEGGTFIMGSVYNPFDGITDYADEEPAHNVTLTTYSIGETEVTQELWKAVMGSDSPASWGENTGNDVYYPQRPAEFISWVECQTFITNLNQLTGKNFRLPTEAEWEYAARGGNRSKGYMYSGSDDVGEVAWYSGNLVDVEGKTKTHDVKTKKANELGIYDMSGNVLEWCNDWYGDHYYGNSPGENPQGPDQAETSTEHRVCRGGGWGHEAEYCRVAKRFSKEQETCASNYGFRLCL